MLGALVLCFWGMTLHAQVAFNQPPKPTCLPGCIYFPPSWHDTDLTAITGGPNTFVEIGIAFDQAWGYTRTHYRAVDDHVDELAFYGGRWQDADLTAITGGPLASTIAIAFDQAWGYTRTHYSGWYHHVHELAFYGGRWQDADLTAITGGPNTFGDIAIAFDQAWNLTRTHYVGSDYHVHELAFYGGRWQDADLTAITGDPTPLLGISPSPLTKPGTSRVPTIGASITMCMSWLFTAAGGKTRI